MKKGDIKYSFIVVVLILLIVLAFILINSGAFGKSSKFITNCVSASPIFDYECADRIPGNTGSGCPLGWSTDNSKDCKEGISCCFREK